MSPELITAIAALLWPIVTLVVVLIFRKDIAAVLTRLRKGKLLGQELELEPAVQEFRNSVTQVEKELVPIAPSPTPADDTRETQTDDDIARILDDAAQNASVGLIRLSALLEKEVKALLALMGHLQSVGQLPAPSAMAWLSDQGMLPKHTLGSLKIFWDLRNRIVHGGNPPSQSEILRVIDIGLTLLRALRAIPHEVNVVFHPGVILYSDSQCKKKIEGVFGLILETTSPGGGIVSKRIFPTTRPSYYKKGKPVTWEWNLSKTWGNAWYISPGTKEAQMAWGSSAEFVGRHVDEL